MPSRGLRTALGLETVEERREGAVRDQAMKKKCPLLFSTSTMQGKEMSWTSFSQDAADAGQVKETFKEMVKLLSSTFGGDQIFVQQTTYLVYITLSQSMTKKLSKLRQQISNVLGPVPNAVFEQLVHLVTTLHEWRQQRSMPSVEAVYTSRYQLRSPYSNEGDDPVEVALGNMQLELPCVSKPQERRVELPAMPIEAQSGHDNAMVWLCKELGSEELGTAVLQMLQQDQSDVYLQEGLLNLLGFERIELISDIFQKRVALMQCGAAFTQQQPTEPRQEPQVRAKKSNGPSVTTGVVIMTQEEKERRKRERKSGKKPAVLEEESNPIDDLGAMRSIGTQRALPLNAERQKKKGYEEIFIPAPQQADLVKGVQRLKIEDVLDQSSATAFRGVDSLNALQTTCFDTAYHSNENMLVAAPTGAGKTNVAMLTVLQELNRHTVNGILQVDQFKIVYVAPMKALAQEVVFKFGKRLSALGVVVKELTGDMQLTKSEIESTQMIVTTPEKWDVITRKANASGSASGQGSVSSLVRLLIIDEVHLLHEDRGSVLETLVARTVRQVEVSQSMIRIVGLSATLPNYTDVAQFLRVNLETGLFRFDDRYRPVPLDQTYIGVHDPNAVRRRNLMNKVCYDKVVDSLARGHQVMVFVHSRRDTAKTAEALLELAKEHNSEGLFAYKQDAKTRAYEEAKLQIQKGQSKEMKQLFSSGLGIHHAGLIRADRGMTERMFEQGYIRVLCCTATLAWGVNLPAHTVIIKGTDIYDAKRGGWVDLGMLDVMQIFGRAGRPQYDTSGEGIIITQGDKLNKYLSLLTHAVPIESTFVSSLPDNLNAEIVLGTVSTLEEALTWLSYTYLYIRILRNPIAYGVSYHEQQMDPNLFGVRKTMLLNAIKELLHCKMIRFDPRSGALFPTELGRTASHYYLHHASVAKYNDKMHPNLFWDEVLHLICVSREFEQIRVREEEFNDMDKLTKNYCQYNIIGGVEHNFGKTNALLQAFISRAPLSTSSLISDTHYITQSAGRIARALFHICLKLQWTSAASKFLLLYKMIQHRMWDFETPLRQVRSVKLDTAAKIEQKNMTLDRLAEMSASEIGALVQNAKQGKHLYHIVRRIPTLELSTSVKPITRTVILLDITIVPEFEWNDVMHGSVVPFLLWIEDSENEFIYHSEEFLLHKKTYKSSDCITLHWSLPIFEPMPSHYFLRSMSLDFIGGDTTCLVPLQEVVLPESYAPYTTLLDLLPLPVSALNNTSFEGLYSAHFSHFNPLQTQCFHTAYHSDESMLVGAPTGSGKTVVGELACMRLFQHDKGRKVVYVAPLKALAKQRMLSWKATFGSLGYRILELTGDVSPDGQQLQKADMIITTPEKWDAVTRSWKTKSKEYVQHVGLVLFDEIHLLGQDRGAILEVIVSRLRFMASQMQTSCRLIGLSTAIANANDLASWLGVNRHGLFNFPPQVRPVPITVHISGFPGKHYCPRMASMNKPLYNAIQSHSSGKPVLVFVSSRRQTRLTALDLISYAAAEGRNVFSGFQSEAEIESLRDVIRDSHLMHAIAFGIGLHHAGLSSNDRLIVEQLFLDGKLQVLVSTSTLAWGVNLPAHLVVIKGTEFFDARVGRYVDMPLTDVLQMMGRAGRPQFDTQGKAVLFVHEDKKNFYRKFLYEAFPVESALLDQLADPMNAEMSNGSILSVQDAVDYLSTTFLYRRLLANPTFYQCAGDSADTIADFFHDEVHHVLKDLEKAQCITVDPETRLIEPTHLSHIASYYYVSFKTVAYFHNQMEASMTIPQLLHVLCHATEFEEIPVRHNEDVLNEILNESVEYPLVVFDTAQAKTNLLLQARMLRLALPISDYITDTKSVMDQAVRVLQAMIDIAAEQGLADTVLAIMSLVQGILQARLPSLDHAAANLAHMTPSLLSWLKMKKSTDSLFKMVQLDMKNKLDHLLSKASHLDSSTISKVLEDVRQLPHLQVSASITEASVTMGCEYTVRVRLERHKAMSSSGIRVFGIHRELKEGYWLLLSFRSTSEVLALQRITFPSTKKHVMRDVDLICDAPDLQGDFDIDVMLVPECYQGLNYTARASLCVSR